MNKVKILTQLYQDVYDYDMLIVGKTDYMEDEENRFDACSYLMEDLENKGYEDYLIDYIEEEEFDKFVEEDLTREEKKELEEVFEDIAEQFEYEYQEAVDTYESMMFDYQRAVGII